METAQLGRGRWLERAEGWLVGRWKVPLRGGPAVLIATAGPSVAPGAASHHGVLLLGRFGGGGIEILQAIAARLRELEYLPIIFDFERPDDRNLTETIKTLVGMSRFVIADLSGPSVPQELHATVPHFKVPFALISEEGRRPYSMSNDLVEYPWVIGPPIVYSNVEHLLAQLSASVITPVEERLVERRARLNDLFGAT